MGPDSIRIDNKTGPDSIRIDSILEYISISQGYQHIITYTQYISITNKELDRDIFYLVINIHTAYNILQRVIYYVDYYR